MGMSAGTAPAFPLPEDVPVDVVILPREVDGSGTGLYDNSVVTLEKELRSFGASAEYEHGPDSRQWIGERSVAVIVLSVVLGIASNAGWDAVKCFFSERHPKDKIKGKVARCTQTADGITWEWFDIEGTGEELAKAFGEIQPPSDDVAPDE